MKRGAYIFWLAILALFLFGASRFLPTSSTEPQHQRTEKSSPTAKQDFRAQPKKNSHKSSIRLVRLYPAGTLKLPKTEQLKKPKPKEAKNSPDRESSATKASAAKPTTKPISASLEREGDRPVLEVSYDEIGFNRYLDVIEAVGRIFLLFDDGSNMALGPEVSLKSLSVFGPVASTSQYLAFERPHLVSDPFIHDLLTVMDLPKDALNDRIVLLFNRPFDNMLWDLIRETAADNNLPISKIARISGSYVTQRNGVFLKLDHAVLRNSNKTIPFARQIRVTL